jgi:large subunit ribosomal protein L22
MSRARADRRPARGDLIATARASFMRVPPRKARTVVDLIRGLSVAQATRQLNHLHRPSATPLVKSVLASAVANAKQSEYEDDTDELIVGEILVDGGPMLKRFQPRAMGRACVIRKRFSHLTIKLYKEA